MNGLAGIMKMVFVKSSRLLCETVGFKKKFQAFSRIFKPTDNEFDSLICDRDYF